MEAFNEDFYANEVMPAFEQIRVQLEQQGFKVTISRELRSAWIAVYAKRFIYLHNAHFFRYEVVLSDDETCRAHTSYTKTGTSFPCKTTCEIHSGGTSSTTNKEHIVKNFQIVFQGALNDPDAQW